MAGEELYTFSREGMLKLVEDHRRLQAQYHNLMQRVEQIRHDSGPGSRLLLGKTATNEKHPNYPTEKSNQYLVKIQTWDWDESPGLTDLTDSDHGTYVVGRTQSPRFIKEGSEVLVVETRGRKGLRHMILDVVPVIHRAKAAEAIATGASGDVDVYLDGAVVDTIEAWNDWDAGDVADNDELRIVHRPDLDRWEILKRGSGSSTTINPVMFWDAIERGVGSTYPRGGSYASSEYYTFDYQKVRGDYAANHLTPLDAYSAGLPFVQIDQDGAYEISADMRFAVSYNGTDTETYTTSGPSVGTNHNHTVTVWRGKEMFPLVLMFMQYQVGGAGAWTSVPRSEVRTTGIAAVGYQTGTMEVAVSLRRIVNLTAGWTLRQYLGFQTTTSLSDHAFVSASAQSLMIRYLGAQMSDASI